MQGQEGLACRAGRGGAPVGQARPGRSETSAGDCFGPAKAAGGVCPPGIGIMTNWT